MEEMNELFYRDPYAREFEAEVLSCESGKKGFEVTLSDTAFYPEGGGQPTDTGKLGDATVNFVKRLNGKIIHYTDRPIAVGTTVKGVIDWDRRYDNMQNHTCEHIFSGLVHQKFSYENVGFHMDADDITVDFSGEIPPEDIAKLERLVNEAIWEDISLTIYFPSEEELGALNYRSKKELSGKVRIVSVGHCDCCACCGTHVRRSGEIGVFKILEATKHRGGTRVRFAAGLRALREFDWRQREISSISALLSAKPREVSEVVERFLEEDKAKDIRIAERTNLWLETRTVNASGGLIIDFIDGLSPFELKRYAALLQEREPEVAVAVLSESDPQVFSYVLSSREDTLGQISRALNQALNGRGGGRGGIVQGTFRAGREEIEKELKRAFSLEP